MGNSGVWVVWVQNPDSVASGPHAKLYHLPSSREGVMPAANKITLTGLALQNTTDDRTTQQNSVPLSPDSQMLFWGHVWVEPPKVAYGTWKFVASIPFSSLLMNPCYGSMNMDLGDQQAWFLAPALPLTSCITLGVQSQPFETWLHSLQKAVCL